MEKEIYMKKIWRYVVGITAALLLLSGCAGKEKDGDISRTALSADAAEGLREADCLLRVTFLDTGKSDCIVMEAGDHVVVNDAADADDAGLIDAFLEKRQVETIDYLILSHFDKDHIGSAAARVSE